jgi:drug/metabolite transporter (DMT)-like permease
MKHLPLFIFALIAAVGNALFASGQKKAVGVDNSLLFIGFSALICVILTFIFTLFIKEGPTMTQIITKNYVWIGISGVGLFLTYVGFNLLYRHFGATGYVYYAVLSIITTSIIVGVVIFKEAFNTYHLISVLLAVSAIIFFTVGNNAR